MRRLALIYFTLMFAVASSAQQQPDSVIAPVVTQDLKNQETTAGVLMADIREQPLNTLDVIRAELQRLQNQEHLNTQKEGVFLSTTKRFTPESLTFFVAIGAVTFGSMWIHSHGDPLAMEKHILSLKDPIANLSFYSFMVANGYYINFRTNTMDPHTKAQMMKRLSYQGMAVGSLASSVVSDIGQSARMCVDQWLLGKNDETSVQACNEAWKSWTVRGKFTQYFPQIISMWASQAATEFADRSIKWGFEKATPKAFAKKLLNKQWLVKQAYKVTGADLALTLTGGTWAIKGIKLAGKLTQFGLFVSVDHFLSQYTLPILNNVIQPALFDFDAMAINKYWAAFDDGNWEENKVIQPPPTCLPPSVFTLFTSDKCYSSTFELEIEAYGKHAQQWRENLNSNVEADLAGWMDMTKKLLNQVDYSYKFYSQFTSSLFETLNARHRIHTQEADSAIMTNKSIYPFRTLPLYGVSMGEIQILGGAANDLYLNRPFEIEKRQLENIKTVLANVKSTDYKLQGNALQKYTAVVDKLSDSNLQAIASGLNDLNQILDNGSTDNSGNAFAQYDANQKSGLIAAFRDLRNKLGSPHPIVYPLAGFSQAFAINAPLKVVSDAADFSLWSASKKFKFNKDTDLLMYKILCGSSVASFDKTNLLGVDFFMPQFDPPSLLIKNADGDAFCNSTRTTNNLYSAKIGEKNLQDYILSNLNYQAVGDFRNKESSGQFAKWWLANGKAPVTKEFAAYDNSFKELVQLNQKNVFNNKAYVKRVSDQLNQSQYLKNSLQDQFKVETEFYLQLIQRALTKEPKKAISKDVLGYRNYLLETVKNSDSQHFIGLHGVTYSEIKELSKLMSDFTLLIANPKIVFEDYISHSKKIDTAINAILVASGFKKLEVKKGTSNSDDLSAAPSATGSEESENVYTDLEVKNPNLRQRVILAAVKGLRQIESENRRFIRMKILLSQSLEIDTKEFMADWNNNMKSTSQARPAGAQPRGSTRSTTGG